MFNILSENRNRNSFTKPAINNQDFDNLKDKLLFYKEFLQKNEGDASPITEDNLIDIYEILRDIIYQYCNHFVNLNLHSEVTQIINSLEFIALSNNSKSMSFIRILEKLFFLFIFHFNFNIINLSLAILKFLLNQLDYEFHKECMQNIIKILHIVKVKKHVNNIMCNKIISNLTLSLLTLIYNTNQEVRKSFYDFLSTNNEDYILIYLLCYNCNDEINFSKFFSVEQISNIIEKSMKLFDKHLKQLENNINELKRDCCLTTKNKIKQTIDLMNCVVKLMDSFMLRGNKSYNYDKLIKSSVIPSIKKFWNLLLFDHDEKLLVL